MDPTSIAMIGVMIASAGTMFGLMIYAVVSKQEFKKITAR